MAVSDITGRFTVSDAYDWLDSNDLRNGQRTWQKAFSDLDVNTMSQLQQSQKSLSKSFTEGYRSLGDDLMSVRSSDLISGMKNASEEEFNKSVNSAYENYVKTLQSQELTIRENYINNFEKLESLKTSEASNYANTLETIRLWALESVTDEDAFNQSLFETSTDGSKNLSITGRNLVNQALGSNQGEYLTWLAKQTNNSGEQTYGDLASWLTSGNPYDFTQLGTGMGSVKNYAGIQSEDMNTDYIDMYLAGDTTVKDKYVDSKIESEQFYVSNLENYYNDYVSLEKTYTDTYKNSEEALQFWDDKTINFVLSSTDSRGKALVISLREYGFSESQISEISNILKSDPNITSREAIERVISSEEIESKLKRWENYVSTSSKSYTFKDQLKEDITKIRTSFTKAEEIKNTLSKINESAGGSLKAKLDAGKSSLEMAKLAANEKFDETIASRKEGKFYD